MTAWGIDEGDVVWAAGTFVASDRLLMFTRSPRLSGLVGAFAERTIDLIDTSLAIGEAFDLATAEGVHLDRIGAILQLPRYGYADDRYRLLLQIQAQLVLSSTTTTTTILRIVELFTGSPAISYADAYPMGYRIAPVKIESVDEALFLRLIRDATAAAYGVQVILGDADAVIGDYSSDPLDLDASDIGDYSTDPIAGAGTGSYTFNA